MVVLLKVAIVVFIIQPLVMYVAFKILKHKR